MSFTEWVEAFTKAQEEMPAIGKTKTADMGNYSYTYADLGSILEAVRPVLNKHGLSVAQSPVSDGNRVGVETRIYHEAGHVETFGPLYLPAGNNAQGAGSAVTYARRYSLTAALGLSPDDDDDGAKAIVVEAPDVEGKDWLANAVQSFSEWSETDRENHAMAAVKALKVKKPMSLVEAKKVHARMAKLYYEEHPNSPEAPF